MRLFHRLQAPNDENIDTDTNLCRSYIYIAGNIGDNHWEVRGNVRGACLGRPLILAFVRDIASFLVQLGSKAVVLGSVLRCLLLENLCKWTNTI